MRTTNLFAFLWELSLHQQASILKNELGKDIFYDAAEANKWITKTEIISWKQKKDMALTPEQIEEKEFLSSMMTEEELEDYFYGEACLQFEAKIFVKEKELLKDMQIDEAVSTTLDTFELHRPEKIKWEEAFINFSSFLDSIIKQ